MARRKTCAAISKHVSLGLPLALPRDSACPTVPSTPILTRTSSRAPRDGDTRAFDDLVRKYTPKLYGLVYNMTSNREDTADLLQDIFAKAYRSLKRFQGKSTFYTWIYSISVNMTLNFLKKRGRYTKLSLDDVDSGIQNDPDFIKVTSGGQSPEGREYSRAAKKVERGHDEAV